MNHYSYRVFWSDEDEEFVGVCSEFQGLSHLARTAQAAFDGIRELIAFVVADMQKEKRSVPAPLASQSYSGNLRLRLPPNLHKSLALEARESETSLNRLIINKLAGAGTPAPRGRAAKRTGKVATKKARRARRKTGASA